MVPVRFISENIGLTVEWDNDTKTVSISGANSVEPENASFTVQKSNEKFYYKYR